MVEIFGYDGGPQQATLIVTPWAPTPGAATSLGPISWDVGTRTSGNQLDASYTVSGSQLASVLGSATPVAQGFHLRIEVEVTGSQGADDKFHMLWIAPCTPSGGVTPPTSTGTPTTPTGGTSVTTLGNIFQGLIGPAPSTAGGTAAVTAGDSRGRSGLAFTGVDIAALAMAGLLSLVSGAAILLLQRRRRVRAALSPNHGGSG
jgi:hypothetical protein